MKPRTPRAVFAIPFALALALVPAIASGAEPLFPPPEVRGWQTGTQHGDLLQHASLAMTGGLSIGLITREPAAAFGGAVALGLFKELWDARHDRFDWLDVAADVLGAGGSAVVTRALAR